MYYGQFIKDRVRQLRASGLSLSQIHRRTSVPNTTIRTWIKDIKLSKEQEAALKERTLRALQKGRIKQEKIQKENRLKKEKILITKGKKDIGKLSTRDLFITGIALYWAEGFKNKHEHRLGFCNSDPDMIRFYIQWVEEALNVQKNNLVARLSLNITYKEKAEGIQNYWSKITGIPLSQFTKPFYQKTRWKKQYKNDNYYGVLRIHVKKSLDYLLRMKGWIEGLKLNLPA